MKLCKVGGVIAAASRKDAQPMMRIGSIPVIKRIVISFRQAGIFPIVVVTGHEEDEVKYQLSNYGVVFIHNDRYEAPPLFDSVKIGLTYLQDKCDKMVFVPVNVPMFSPVTLRTLLNVKGDIVTPSYNNRGGHPVVLSSEVIPDIMGYNGEKGLRGAIDAVEDRRLRVAVEDAGILYSAHNPEELQLHVEKHNQELLHPHLRISLEKEVQFFDDRTKLLLFLIYDTKSVRQACNKMALSYGKAWDMLNKLEEEIALPVIDRRHGGNKGGRTDLTEHGIELLMAYQEFENNVFQYTHNEFQRLFQANKLIKM
jgi:molybdate transport repressor ModE-like protein